MELVKIVNNQELGLVVSSRTVADELGKQHKHVLESIDKLIVDSTADISTLFILSEYQASNGKMNREYLLKKDGFILYMFNIQGHNDFKMAYINRFNEMEQVIKENQIKLPSDPMEILELVFNANKKTDKRVEAVEADVIYLKDNVKLDASEYGVITNRVNEKVRNTITNYNLANSKDVKRTLFKDLNGAIKTITNTATRSQLKQKHFDEVLEFINTWEPSSQSLHKVRQMKIEDL